MNSNYLNFYESCTLCPRSCKINRLSGATGYCGQSSKLHIARAALHMWEEPCISGTTGSGTIFFCGCQLRCVFCQNAVIATSCADHYPICTDSELVDHFFRLKELGANNINLVTGDHYIPTIASAIRKAKDRGFALPFVYNTGSYVSVESIRQLDGLIDIYLPDFKYWDPALAQKYSNAPDYRICASAIIAEMVRQTGQPHFQVKRSGEYLNAISYNDRCESGEEILLKRGTIVRQILLPGQLEDSKQVIAYLLQTYGTDIYISIMNQYTPMSHIGNRFPELNCKVSESEYDALLDHAIDLGIENGFLQEGDVASESFIPPF